MMGDIINIIAAKKILDKLQPYYKHLSLKKYALEMVGNKINYIIYILLLINKYL